MKSNDKKQTIIQKVKTLLFRKEISKATESPLGIWKLARWAKDKSQKPREIPKNAAIEARRANSGDVRRKSGNAESQILSPPPADLSDISGSFYPAAADCPMKITNDEVIANVQRLKSDNAPGPDGITNRILKACSTKLAELLTPLFHACVTHAYHPREFKKQTRSRSKNRERKTIPVQRHTDP